MYLFFDTETTGLLKKWKAPATELNNWPRLVQMAYLYYDRNGKLISGGDFIIRPVGYTIQADATRIHGISTEKAMDEGKSLLPVKLEFQSLVDESEYLVAHNISFDDKIDGAEFLRNKMPESLASK
jgi:DNA polymerase III epsilon subunit-like protein